jgi:hypothetical protein
VLERGQDERPLECLRQAHCRADLGQATATLGQVRASDGDASETALDLRHNIGVLLLSQGKATEAAAVLRPLYNALCLVLGPQDESAQEASPACASRKADPNSPRRAEIQLGPHRLAGRGPEFDAPTVCEGADDHESATGLRQVVRSACRAGRQPVEASIDHLDAQPVRVVESQPQPEVASRHAPVLNGVHGQLGHDVRDGTGDGGVVGPAPLGELLDGEPTREPCATTSGRQLHGELTTRYGGTLTIHVTQRVRPPLR